MLYSKEYVGYLAREITKKLIEGEFVDTPDAAVVRERVNAAMLEELSLEDRINDEDLEDARWLRTYAGKTGFVQLGWPFQGSIFLYEASTEWYDRYQRLAELSDDFGGIPIDEPGPDEEE